MTNTAAPATHPAEKTWFQIRAAATGGPTEILIYDEIGYWGTTADIFAERLLGLDVDEITVRINSPGGLVYDGIAILNALRSHKASITTVVDGMAASAASFIAMAGDVIIMRPNAEMMIHNASGGIRGTAVELREYADQLERMNANIASIYAGRAGGKSEEWLALMDVETWFSAEEAVEAGLADRVEASSHKTEKAANSFDLSVFAHAGRAAAPAPKILTHLTNTSAAVEAAGDRKGRSMTTLNDHLVTRLGIDAAADEDTILAALDEALAERADDTPTGGLPSGVVAIEAGVLEELRTNAALGAQARQRQETAECAALVDAKISSGAVTPARREHWLTALAADRVGAEAAINTLADGLVPLEEIGHAGDGDSTPTDVRDTAAYQNWK